MQSLALPTACNKHRTNSSISQATPTRRTALGEHHTTNTPAAALGTVARSPENIPAAAVVVVAVAVAVAADTLVGPHRPVVLALAPALQQLVPAGTDTAGPPDAVAAVEAFSAASQLETYPSSVSAGASSATQFAVAG